MNVLYLCKTDPRTPQGGSGESVRTYLLWKSLIKKHNVYSYVYDVPNKDASKLEKFPVVFHKKQNIKQGIVWPLLFK